MTTENGTENDCIVSGWLGCHISYSVQNWYVVQGTDCSTNRIKSSKDSEPCRLVPILEGLVSGVAQWLGRRSLAGGLSLIFAGSMVDM